jgi:hypothetical protein
MRMCANGSVPQQVGGAGGRPASCRKPRRCLLRRTLMGTSIPLPSGAAGGCGNSRGRCCVEQATLRTVMVQLQGHRIRESPRQPARPGGLRYALWQLLRCSAPALPSTHIVAPVALAVGASATWGQCVGIAQGLRDGRWHCRHVCLAPRTDSPFKVQSTPEGPWVVTTNFGDLL